MNASNGTGTGARAPVLNPVDRVTEMLFGLSSSPIAMLFAGGLALGRYAGYGSWKTGALMAGLGMAIVAALIALGG
jgi:hypothetical protein